MRRLGELCGLLLAFACACVPASADILRFRNGDELVGVEVRREGRVIFFRTETFGLIRVNESDAEVISGRRSAVLSAQPKATVVASEGAIPPPPTRSAAIAAQTASDASGADEADVAAGPPPSVEEAARRVAQVRAAVPPEEKSIWEDNMILRFLNTFKLREGWDSRLEFGYTWKSGEFDDQDVDLKFSTETQWGSNRLSLEASYLYGVRDRRVDPDSTVEGDEFNVLEKNQDRYEFIVSYRRDFAETLFVRTEGRYLHDFDKSINHQFNVDLTAGWTYVDNSRWKGDVSTGGSYRYRESFSTAVEKTVLAIIEQNLTFTLNERVRFPQYSRLGLDPGKGIDEFLGRIAMEVLLTDRFSINLRYEFHYRDRVSVEPVDQTASTSFGYSF